MYFVVVVNTLLKVVSHYDSKCSVHVNDGFPKNSLAGDWVGRICELSFYF